MALLFLWEWGAGFAGWCGVGGGGFRLGFRCAGIRNSKCPCGRLWKADASTPDEPSMAPTGVCAAIRGSTSLCVGRGTKIF